MTPLHHGIYFLDAHYVQAGVAAVYLLVQEGKVCIVETGTSPGVPNVLRAIESLGFGVEDVAYVIPTHIHLDHAGGAGAFIEACSEAKLVIHPRGAAHMIDPQKLIAGTQQVYGESRYFELYGQIVPVPEERVIIADDGFTLDVAGRSLRFIDTPGHALHHFCVVDELSSGVFTGDTFGIAYPHLATDQGPFIFATTTPTQFDPDALLQSIDRILESNPDYIYLTHFGQIEVDAAVVERIRQSVRDQAALALELKGQPQEREARLDTAINRLFVERMLELGGQESAEYYRQQFRFDSRLNAQGLDVWLQRLERAA